MLLESPLFTGDAGSGESEIRRWILENDWLEAFIALPEQLFYNTGISTYVRVLSNRKDKRRKNKVQLIDASGFWTPLRKSLGNKRREISDDQIKQVLGLYTAAEAGEHCRVFDTTEFGYRKITLERPLRLNFQAGAERLARLEQETGFQNLALSKKKDAKARATEEAEGRKLQAAILKALRTVPDALCKDRAKFLAPVRKAILSAWASGTRPPRFAETTTAARSLIPNCGIRRMCRTPGSTRASAITRMARSARWAARSISTATSTNISRPASARSRVTSGLWSPKLLRC